LHEYNDPQNFHVSSFITRSFSFASFCSLSNTHWFINTPCLSTPGAKRRKRINNKVLADGGRFALLSRDLEHSIVSDGMQIFPVFFKVLDSPKEDPTKWSSHDQIKLIVPSAQIKIYSLRSPILRGELKTQ
jgi:hypothetical protein